MGPGHVDRGDALACRRLCLEFNPWSKTPAPPLTGHRVPLYLGFPTCRTSQRALLPCSAGVMRQSALCRELFSQGERGPGGLPGPCWTWQSCDSGGSQSLYLHHRVFFGVALGGSFLCQHSRTLLDGRACLRFLVKSSNTHCRCSRSRC